MQTTNTMTPTSTTSQASDDSPSPLVDYARLAPDALRAQLGLESYIHKSGLEESLMNLIKLRASYINGCAYCIDMHTKEARLAGETEQRLYAIPVWHETPFFTPRERVALAWAEAVTEISKGGVSDALREMAQAQFTEKELVDLTMVVIAINGWNRLSITFRTPVGSYVAGSAGKSRTEK